MPLTKAELLKPRSAKVEPFDLLDLGQVFLRKLTARERTAFEAGNYQIDMDTGEVTLTRSNADARLCAYGLADESGARLFNADARLAVLVLSDEQGNRQLADEDADTLGDLPGAAEWVHAVADAGRRFNRMGRGDTETARKNSEPTTNGALPCA